MKKLTTIIALIILVLSVPAQTFKWKELANLNTMSLTEKTTWLEEEKGFVLVSSEDGFTYRDTTSSLDEEIFIHDSVAIYLWTYKFNPEVSKTKAIDYIMSKSLAYNRNNVYLEEEKDEDGNVIIDALVREKYSQILSTGNIYNADGSRINYAAAEISQ